MCNRARYLGEPETLVERFGAKWLADRLMDNRFNPQELVPFGRAWASSPSTYPDSLEKFMQQSPSDGESSKQTVQRTRRNWPLEMPCKSAAERTFQVADMTASERKASAILT